MKSKHPVIAAAYVWLDDDGQHVWFVHDCTRRRVVTMLPYPTWRAIGQKVEPSIHCETCGCHGIFDLTIDAPRDEWDKREDRPHSQHSARGGTP